jgi:mono/diheme cytochrome c family protein
MGQTPSMFNLVVGALALAFVIAPTAVAQPGSELGQQLYRQHCALCHQDSGAGAPPMFPALSGNDQLANAARIVRSIHAGTSRMPPFPALAAEDVASLATYIRNAWANDFGGVTTEAVTTVLDGLAETGPVASVWDGVFTDAQATRGQAVYAGACAICHGRRLNGAPDDPDMRSTPPLARARFVRVWEGRSLATLFEYTRATMPEDNPSSLTSQENVDVIAYLLSVGGMPAGDVELPADPQRLARVVIGPQP